MVVSADELGKYERAESTASIAISVSMLHRLGSVFLSSALSELGVGVGQHAILLAVVDRGGLTQDDLARHFYVDKATVARAAAKLESGGLIVRDADPEDGRAYRLSATRKGREIAPRIQVELDKWEAELLRGMGKAERKTLGELLKRAARNAGERLLTLPQG